MSSASSTYAPGVAAGRSAPTWWVVFLREAHELWVGGKAPVLLLVYTVLLGLLTLASFAIDFAATAMGAKRVGATKLAVVGAALGTLGGLFLGPPGLVLGPFVGAVIGEMLSHGQWQQATRAGIATWMGLLFGTLTKLALVFTMLGIFVFAYFV